MAVLCYVREVRVPFFDMAAELAPVRAEIDAAIKRVLDSGAFIGGPEVAAFEQALATKLRAAHAIGTSSGTDALLAIYMAMGIGPGDEVVTTPLTFFATAGSAARLGAKVVFADVDDETLCLDPRAAMNACTRRTRAIVPVNLFGYLAELPATTIPIVEDAAHSLSAPRGLAAALSFFPTKNLGALGDAGAVLTNDAAFADRIALLRTHGARPKYHHIAVGGNFRLDALQAAVLAAKLPHAERASDARRAHADRYRAMLAAANVPVRLPPASPVHQFVIRTERRDALRVHLREAGIGTEVYYPEPLHRQPCFLPSRSLPIAERVCSEVLALPIYPSLLPEMQVYVVERIATFFR